MHPQMSTTVFYLKMTSGDHHTTSLSVILIIDELEGEKKTSEERWSHKSDTCQTSAL